MPLVEKSKGCEAWLRGNQGKASDPRSQSKCNFNQTKGGALGLVDPRRKKPGEKNSTRVERTCRWTGTGYLNG